MESIYAYHLKHREYCKMDIEDRLSEALIAFSDAAMFDETFDMTLADLEEHFTKYEAKKKALYEVLGDMPLAIDEIVTVVSGLKKKLDDYCNGT